MSEKDQPKVEIVPIESLMPDPSNVNRGTERGSYMLNDSITKRGAGRSILTTADGVILAGNKTHEQAVNAGFTEVIKVHTTGQQLVAVVRDDLEHGDPDATRLAIEDNRIGQASLEFDPAVLLALAQDDGSLTDGLWRDDEWEELLGDLFEPPDDEPPPLAQLDKADELQQKWGVKLGDLWEIGRHLLYCADSTAIEIDAPGNLFYDPPWDAQLDFNPAQWENVLAFCDGRRAGDIVGLMGAPSWVFSWDCVTSWYVPNRPLQRAKYCFWYGDVTRYNFNGAHYGEPLKAHTVQNTRGAYEFKPDKRGKHLSDVFQLGITGLHKDGAHKHEKPLDWVRLLVGNCFGGDAYDPFTGSGTTFVACEQLGRRAVGVEIEPKNCALVLQRLCEMGQEPRRANA